jgi:ubiquinone/menaquinone biosynthesis C-methylase UbiE
MARLRGYEYWDEKARSYDKWNEKIVGGGKTEELIDAWLLAQVHADDIVLDLGCGTGRYASVLAGAVAHVTAADMAPAMLEEAGKKLARFDNVSVQRQDCFRTSFGADTFDVLVLGNLLHVVTSPESVVREALRLLRPGGRLHTIDYTGSGMSPFALMRLMFRILTTWGLPSPDNQLVDTESMRRMVTDAGFQVTECVLLGDSTKAVCLQATRPER